MGARYIVFRTLYEIRKKTGLLKRKYPVSYKIQQFISLTSWKGNPANFFFNSRDDLSGYSLDQKEIAHLKSEFQHIKEGKIKFFDAFHVDLANYDWITNPDSGYKYVKRQHWTKINEFVPENGDIKYVWEKSRFCYLNTIIRYDRHCNDDQAKFVFEEILSWIEANPLNCGPNYTSSQEIAIRVLNWIFALYYYKHSEFLTNEVFLKVINSIYWQTKHVEKNINFSRIAVRNNHVITESLLLYVVGLLFPFLPNSPKFKKKGKRYLEEEGCQIYQDGSYLQFSFNYHRVVIQLYTWAFYLARANNEKFSDQLHDRLKKSLDLLYQHQDTITGMLPNYGANDGSLFFKLNNCGYRDFRPQLNALHYYF
ncbi:MAG: heparinase, partial [Bacteroidetes bacterium]|nr:heparinase [Bacteroidota bacterium]